VTTPLSPAPLNATVAGDDKQFDAAWKRWINELSTTVRSLSSAAPSPSPPPSPPATLPGGVNTYVQFNDSGTFGGSSQFTYNKASNTLSVTKAVINNLDSSIIGASTPAAGTFTTLNATTLGFLGDTNLVLSQRSFFRPAPPPPVNVADSQQILADRIFRR
jgi:hypothetical protein